MRFLTDRMVPFVLTNSGSISNATRANTLRVRKFGRFCLFVAVTDYKVVFYAENSNGQTTVRLWPAAASWPLAFAEPTRRPRHPGCPWCRPHRRTRNERRSPRGRGWRAVTSSARLALRASIAQWGTSPTADPGNDHQDAKATRRLAAVKCLVEFVRERVSAATPRKTASAAEWWWKPGSTWQSRDWSGRSRARRFRMEHPSP